MRAFIPAVLMAAALSACQTGGTSSTGASGVNALGPGQEVSGKIAAAPEWLELSGQRRIRLYEHRWLCVPGRCVERMMIPSLVEGPAGSEQVTADDLAAICARRAAGEPVRANADWRGSPAITDAPMDGLSFVFSDFDAEKNRPDLPFSALNHRGRAFGRGVQFDYRNGACAPLGRD